MWGSNVPVTRTPDAHWMAEVRYRGTKVVTVSPDYADNTKFADEWLPAQAGTDAALAMAMGHVILREYLVDREVPFFRDYVRTYTDLPFLVTLTERDGAYVPAKNLTSADLGDDGEGAAWKTVLLDAGTGQPAACHAMPATHAITSGLRTSAGRTRVSPLRASMATAAMFTSGTSTPMSRLIDATPDVPPTRLAAASAT